MVTQENIDRAQGIVKKNHGKYNKDNLSKRLRKSYLDEGIDFELDEAKNVVNDLLDSGKAKLEMPEILQYSENCPRPEDPDFISYC